MKLMKLKTSYRKALPSLAASLLLAALTTTASAQAVLVDWTQSWNFMHPTTGALPAGSGATEPNSGDTKWYADQTTFDASYAGPSFTISGSGYEAGLGMGPIGYGSMDYVGNPQPAPGEFFGLNTSLTTPSSGQRFTGYFRTTFTVPDDGNFYVNPVFRFLMDDGGFVYLDGELVLRVNVSSGAADNYTVLASNTTSTESHVREASMSLAPGSSTGGNVATGLAGNSTVVKRITALAPGVHTLAISVHNQSATSSDLDLAFQVQATATDCAIAATATNVIRDVNNTPADSADDLISFTLNVTPTGTVSPSGWVISGPFGSAAVGKSGTYNTSVTITDIPVTEFAGGSVAFTVADSVALSCTSTFTVSPPRIMASDDRDGLNLPVFTLGDLPATGWVFTDEFRSMTLNNGGGGARKVISSEVIDLSTTGAVQFSGMLDVEDLSTGNEEADSFVAYLIIDGNTAAPINLILPHDTLVADGVLTDDELAPTGGFYSKALNYIIPSAANSVQIVIEGINDSPNERFTVHDLRLGAAPPSIQALPGAITFSNQGTVDPSDDSFSVQVTIEPVNLGESTGWTTLNNPPSGLYAVNPVTFGPFAVSAAPVSITITDALNPSISTTINLSPPAQSLTVSPATNIQRIENGVGPADDTLTFDVTISGANGGPGWDLSTSGVNPFIGGFGPVTFTIDAPLPNGTVDVQINDVSGYGVPQTLTVAVPGRYVIGQRDFGSGLQDVGTTIASIPSALWVNDAFARTITINSGVNAQTETVLSEVIDLTAVGAVEFTAKLAANDSSAGSNFDLPDKFKAELIIDAGLPGESVINLVTPYDTGDGASAVPFFEGFPLPNGAPDGWINGYTGTVSELDGFATTLAEYDAHRDRDEFNRVLAFGADSFGVEMTFSHTIPANAVSVQLRITSQGISGTENSILSDVKFLAVVGPPAIVPGASGLAVKMNSSGKVTAASLVAVATGGSGPLTISGAPVPLTRAGGKVSLEDGWLIYEAAAGFTGVDSMVYEITDGTQTTTGNVDIVVDRDQGRTLNVAGITPEGNGNRVTGLAIPGRTYEWQYTDDLTEWIPLGEQFVCPASGVTSVLDPGPLPSSRFYRLIEAGDS